MAKQPESILKERVLADLHKLPKTYAVKIQQVVIRGTLDIFVCVNGYFVALELKRDERQKPDPLQSHVIDKIKKAGGQAFLVHPMNWPDVLMQIRLLAFHSEA